MHHENKAIYNRRRLASNSVAAVTPRDFSWFWGVLITSLILAIIGIIIGFIVSKDKAEKSKKKRQRDEVGQA